MQATPPAPAGTPGTHPLRRAQFGLGKLLDRLHRRAAGIWTALRGARDVDPGDDPPQPGDAAKLLAPGAVLTQKGAGTSSFVIWVGAVVEGASGERLSTRLTVGPESAPAAAEPLATVPIDLVGYCVDSEREESGLPDNVRFFHGHAEVEGLEPGTSYRVGLIDDQLGRARPIRARTLPRPLGTGDRLRVFAASCYDGDTDSRDRLDQAFNAVFGEKVPDLTLLLGDQVYADAPIWRYALMSRHTPRTGLLVKYWRTWGMQPRPERARRGLRGVLGSGPTYFLPDDHEFWNNWPNRTVTAKHSIGNIRTAIRNGRERKLAVVPETSEPAVPPPRDPRFPPENPYQQNYLPVHPAEWEAWSLASFELFGSFQTPPPEGVALSLGEHDPAPDPRTPPDPAVANLVHRPRNRVVQLIEEVEPLTVALLDTRTRRTRRVRHPYHSGFVDRECLDEVLDAADRARVLVLALSQPLLLPAAWLHEQHRPERFSLVGDTGMEDYWHQYQRFWTELVRRRQGRPTVTIGGDIHQSYVAMTDSPQLNLVEVVASPMSLVSGGRVLEVVAQAKSVVSRDRGLDYRPAPDGFLPLWKVVAGPGPGTCSLEGTARSLGCLPKNRSGFAGLVFEQLADEALHLDVRLYDRNRVARAARRGRPIEARVSTRFRLDFGAEPGVSELPVADR